MTAPHPRVLVVRLGALGDVLLALPAARLLRRSLPQARIAWLVEARHAAALAGSRDVDAVHTVATDAWRRRPFARTTRREVVALVAALRAERFDLALDLQGLVKSAFLALVSGARVRVALPPARTRERASGLLAHHRAPEPTGSRHVTDLYLAAAAAGVRLLGGVPAEVTDTADLVPLTDGERRRAEATIAAHGLGAGFAVLNPGAAWVTKRWPAERFGALARRLAADGRRGVFVAHGPGEEALGRAVVEVAHDARVVTFPSDVRELAALLERAALFVGGDTGPYHLARTLGTPTVGLFGPTDPERNGPHAPAGAGEDAVWGKVACSPCYGRTCPTQIECMASIEVEAVAGRALLALGRAARRAG